MTKSNEFKTEFNGARERAKVSGRTKKLAPVKVELVIPKRPEGQPLPTYHELLDHLCTELGVPGSPTFQEAVAHVKARLARLAP